MTFPLKGSFVEVPFPKLLWEIHLSFANGALEIQKRQVTKKLFFQNHEPVFAESNLLHETLGHFLVDQALITEEQSRNALLHSIENKMMFGESLVAMGFIDSTALYKNLRKNLAMKVLDCFLWEDGDYQFKPDDTVQRVQPFTMDCTRLIIRGIDSAYPIERIEREGFLWREKHFQVKPLEKQKLDALALSSQELYLFNLLKVPQTTLSLIQSVSDDEENIVRRLYAFHILGLLEEATEAVRKAAQQAMDDMRATLDEDSPSTGVKNQEAQTSEMKSKEEKPTLPQGEPSEDLTLLDEVRGDYQKLMESNYLDLLSLREPFTPVDVADRFIEFSKKFGPQRFEKPSLREMQTKARDIFLRGARGFYVLSDPDQKQKYLERLQKADPKNKPSKAKGSAFKIETKLLDGNSQYQKGLGFLKQKKYELAIEHFEYAHDIDARKPEYLAYLGWTTYLLNPNKNLEVAKGYLVRARATKPENAISAWLFGKLLLEVGHHKNALPHLKRAVELDPKNIDMVREYRNAEKLVS